MIAARRLGHGLGYPSPSRDDVDAPEYPHARSLDATVPCIRAEGPGAKRCQPPMVPPRAMGGYQSR